MSILNKNITLGIDIGTTSVKMCLLDQNNNKIIDNKSLSYHFDETSTNYSQQNVLILINRIQQCLGCFDLDVRKNITKIGICGQMHGCVLWKSDKAWTYNKDKCYYKINESNISDLYTWQDLRCTKEFLSTLPKPDSYVDYLSTGFGCSTIFWLLKNDNDFLKQFKFSGTIMDFLMTMICGLNQVFMSVHNATGWGYFDPIKQSWNTKILESNGFPIDLLPEIKDLNYFTYTKHNWLGIEPGTKVFIPFGDMQCQFYANLKNKNDVAVLNISTSAQLSFISSSVPQAKSLQSNKGIDYFPYFDNKYLSVAASLNGGNVLQFFINSAKNLINQVLDINISENKIWERILELGNDVLYDDETVELKVKATLFGERHNPNLLASINNIGPKTNLKELTIGICNGIIDNIFEMMPIDFLIESGITKLIGTGNALLRNYLLKHSLERKINNKIDLSYLEGIDSHIGVALIVNELNY